MRLRISSLYAYNKPDLLIIFLFREELAKKAEAERAALTAGAPTSSGEPDPKKPKTESSEGSSESAAAATAESSSSAADGDNKESSEGNSAAAEKTAEGPPAAPVKVFMQKHPIN